MKTFWLAAAGVVACVVAMWCSRTTYAQAPKAPDGRKMIAVDDAILDANEILFVHETQTDISIAFRGLPSQGNGAFTVLYVKKSAENWKALAGAIGVPVPPRANATP